MADYGDAERVGVLGGGQEGVGGAANKKAGRIRQLDAAIDQATGVAPAPTAQGQPLPSVAAGGMSQSQFGGRQTTPEQRMVQQRKLAEILRNRQ